jgi:hypothetical protein
MAINYNEPITFGRHGTAVSLNCAGIDFSEDGIQSWTTAPLAELDIQLPFTRQNLLVQIEASPLIIPDAIPAQQVFIFIGGSFVGFHIFRGHETWISQVDRGVISGRLSRMSMVIPTSISPNTLSLSEDKRELGIYLHSITFKLLP